MSRCCAHKNNYYNFESFCRSLRSSFVMRRNKDRRRFIYYSIYAWGTPLIWTTITILVDKNRWLSDKWSPTMAIYGNMCWFSREYYQTGFETWLNSIFFYLHSFRFITAQHWRGHFLFFLLPSGLHIFLNSVLFVFTSIHCSRVKAEIHRMQTATENDVQTRRKSFLANKAMFV